MLTRINRQVLKSVFVSVHVCCALLHGHKSVVCMKNRDSIYNSYKCCTRWINVKLDINSIVWLILTNESSDCESFLRLNSLSQRAQLFLFLKSEKTIPFYRTMLRPHWSEQWKKIVHCPREQINISRIVVSYGYGGLEQELFRRNNLVTVKCTRGSDKWLSSLWLFGYFLLLFSLPVFSY